MRCLHYLRKFYLNNPVFYSYFCNYRSIYRKILKIAKQTYYINRLASCNSMQKETWKIVNELRGKGNRVEVKSKLTPSQLNNFYCSVGNNITCSLNSSNTDFLHNLKNIAIQNSFFFSPVTIQELKKVLSEIKPNKAPGFDGISVKILLKLPDNALTILTEAINFSFCSGIFPKCLKLAKIVPIFKGGDHDSPSNYRPVALLPILSKVIEKLAKRRIVDYLDRNNILRQEQFGFQTSKGTSDAVLAFLEKLYLTLNDGDVAAAVFCDLTKAFDCVSHEIMLRKLNIYGFRGKSQDWFRSYLSERVQSVCFADEISENQGINCGVPQGSVLGPILFLLYVNDIADISTSGKFTIFADDATILWNSKESKDLSEVINTDLKTIKQWCDANKLCLNISKTSVMSFKCNISGICLDTGILSSLTKNKFLGIYIDSKLKFEPHINILNSKISSNCFALRVLSKEVGETVARNAYFALVESYLRYGISFWGTCSGYLFQSVFVLQKRALRYVCQVGMRDSCKPLFIKEKILTLPSLFVLETVCLLHKKYKHFLRNESVYNTRLTYNIGLPLPSTSQIKDSIVYSSRQLFNHLPLCIRKIYNNKKFKAEVKKVLVARAYYSIQEYLDERF